MLTVAICDNEAAYLEKFKEFIACRRPRDDISLFAYQEWDPFIEAAKSKSFDIIILGENFIWQPEIYNLGKAVIIYLKKSIDSEKISAENPAIYKYQSGEDILRNMFYYYQKAVKENMEIRLFQRKTELIGCYSPSNTIYKTPFAMTLAWHMAKEKRVLYVNLAECAGFMQWFGKEYTRDLGDLLYLLSVNEGNFYGKLGSTVYTMENFDYIPPIFDSHLLCEADAKEYLLLTRFLLEKSDYEVIIYDFGIMIPGFFAMLEQCSIIYMIQEKDLLAKGPAEHFMEIAGRVSQTKLVSRIQSITLAEKNMQPGQASLMNQWIWGSLGEAVRKALGGENENN